MMEKASQTFFFNIVNKKELCPRRVQRPRGGEGLYGKTYFFSKQECICCGQKGAHTQGLGNGVSGQCLQFKSHVGWLLFMISASF